MIGDEEREAGLLAYEQTLAFAALRRKKLPWVYVLSPIVLAAAGGAALMGGFLSLAATCWASAVLFAIFAAWNWRRLRALDGRNRALLARLQAQYGDDLPWLQVERHLAALEKLKAEVAAENSGGEA